MKIIVNESQAKKLIKGLHNKWKEVDGKRVVYLVDPQGNEIRVQALHVHNKNLPVFLSQSK